MDIWRFDGQTMQRNAGFTGPFSEYLVGAGYEVRPFVSLGDRDTCSADAHRRVSGEGPEVLAVLRHHLACWIVTCDGLGEWLHFSTNIMSPWLSGNMALMDCSRQHAKSCEIVEFAQQKA